MKLVLISDDDLLFNTIKYEFEDILISKSLEDLSNCDIIIFDTISREEIISYLERISDRNNKLIININDFSLEGINNIIKPFRLSSLIDKILDFYRYFKDNIVVFSFGTINKNRRTLTIDDKVIQFTEKELEFLVKIVTDSKTKEELLDIVWNSKTFENNIVETTVYNIRQKLLQNEVKDFIICENGIYSVSLN